MPIAYALCMRIFLICVSIFLWLSPLSLSLLFPIFASSFLQTARSWLFCWTGKFKPVPPSQFFLVMCEYVRMAAWLCAYGSTYMCLYVCLYVWVGFRACVNVWLHMADVCVLVCAHMADVCVLVCLLVCVCICVSGCARGVSVQVTLATPEVCLLSTSGCTTSLSAPLHGGCVPERVSEARLLYM